MGGCAQWIYLIVEQTKSSAAYINTVSDMFKYFNLWCLYSLFCLILFSYTIVFKLTKFKSSLNAFVHFIIL